MDVKTAYLNIILKEEVYVSQPEGQKFIKGAVDPTLFTQKEGEHILLIQICADDIIFASTNSILCQNFAKEMSSCFKMSMMRKMSFFLRLQVSQNPRGIFINQSKYALEMLKKYGLENYDVVDTPMMEKSKNDEDPQRTQVDLTRYRSMAGSLIYLTTSRPDLVFDVCMCAQYQAKPTEKHLIELSQMQIIQVAKIQEELLREVHSRVRLLVWLFCTNPILWMRSQLTDNGFNFYKIPLYCNSKSAIALSCNTVQHLRTKHIAIHYHFIKEKVENEVVELNFVKTAYQLEDIFTKALERECFEFLLNRLGMQNMTLKMLKSLAESEEE
ncbi:retrovirus-related pol polyprotein from transposon TNT 1-94 [Tanacetum coccineum]